ncbi:nucleotidyltransferase domain-containing protein [Candidatus Woesearchaeota archaeon]|nr:nucleotidyltransferase domain-containing protein [Candidatus Woesearchaeota archaeon]
MLKGYASYFAAYLVSSLKSVSGIARIVLYGSVARDEATKESDIDIFIEVKKKTKKFDGELKEAEEGFYLSREAAIFKAKGFDNRFSIKHGELKDWKDLYRSIASTGIVLYGPYEAQRLPSGTKHSVIIFWEKIGRNRGAFLNKLYGFTVKGRHYPGILLKFGGRRVGKSCVMLPVQYKSDVFRLIKAHEVKAKVLEVFS